MHMVLKLDGGGKTDPTGSARASRLSIKNNFQCSLKVDGSFRGYSAFHESTVLPTSSAIFLAKSEQNSRCEMHEETDLIQLRKMH